MWVRGQEKDILIDCNRFQIVSSKTMFRIVTNYREDDLSTYYDILGEFSTKEKAIKVLDDIQKCITGYGTKELDCVYDCPMAGTEFHDVFVMPKDSEV